MKIKTAIAVTGLIFATAGHSYTGNDLLEVCGDDASEVKKALCIGYIRGVSEGLQLAPVMYGEDFDLDASTVNAMQMVCYPKGVTAFQVAATVTKQMQLNPEQQHWSAVSIVSYTIRNVWPCHGPQDPKQGDTQL